MRKILSMLTLFLISQSVFAEEIFAKSSLEEDFRKYEERQTQATPQSVLEWLQEGSKRFVKGRSTHGGFPKDMRPRAKLIAYRQRPLAVVLLCIDSRTTPELVFDSAVGDLFTVRVGANVINDDVLGGLEISVESGAKVIVVLGHTDCGGIKAACRNLDLGHMTQLIAKIKPSILETDSMLNDNPRLSQMIGSRTPENIKYIAEVSHMNAKKSVALILQRSPRLREQVNAGNINLVSAVFDVETGKVIFD